MSDDVRRESGAGGKGSQELGTKVLSRQADPRGGAETRNGMGWDGNGMELYGKDDRMGSGLQIRRRPMVRLAAATGAATTTGPWDFRTTLS